MCYIPIKRSDSTLQFDVSHTTICFCERVLQQKTSKTSENKNCKIANSRVKHQHTHESLQRNYVTKNHFGVNFGVGYSRTALGQCVHRHTWGGSSISGVCWPVLWRVFERKCSKQPIITPKTVEKLIFFFAEDPLAMLTECIGYNFHKK